MGLGLALLLALGVLLLLFPYPLFPHSRDVEGLRLRSDAELGAEADAALRDARERILAMELHRPGDRHTVFLCHSERLYRFFCAVTRKPPATQGLIVSSLTRTVVLSAAGIRSARRHGGGGPARSRFEGGLGAAIAHEIAHLQIADRIGPGRSRVLPPWKSEGWADYSAQRAPIRADPGYDLGARLELLQDESAWGGPNPAIDRRHFRWQLLVEFLVEVEGRRFADLVRGDVTEEDAWAGLTAWQARRHRARDPDRQAPAR